MNTSRSLTSIFTAGLILLISAPATRAGIIEDFHFNDATGTLINGAVNSANAGNNWLAHANTVESQVSGGSFQIKKQSLTGQASNALEIANITTGKAWLVVDIAGWVYTGTASTPSERMRFAFLDNDPAAVGTSTVTAEMTIDRSGNGLILSGEALGTGNTAVVADYALPLIRSTPLTIVLELDKSADKYSVYYRDGTPTFTLLGTGNVGERSAGVKREGRSLRWAFTGTFGDGPDEVFNVDRIYLTNMNPIPEPSSWILLLSAVGLTIYTYYRSEPHRAVVRVFPVKARKHSLK